FLFIDSGRLLLKGHTEADSPVLELLQFTLDRRTIDMNIEDIEKNAHQVPAWVCLAFGENSYLYHFPVRRRTHEISPVRNLTLGISEKETNVSCQQKANKCQCRIVQAGQH